MWIHENLKHKVEPVVVSGGVCEEYDVVGESLDKNMPFVFPYGLYSKPSYGQELVFLKGQREFCIGTIAEENETIHKGEVLFYNDAGAKVLLCQDGSVNINGLIINSLGEIMPVVRGDV